MDFGRTCIVSFLVGSFATFSDKTQYDSFSLGIVIRFGPNSVYFTLGIY